MIEHAHVPFSIRYPSAWQRDFRAFGWRLAVFRDPEEPARRALSIATEFVDEMGFRAEHSRCFDEPVDEAWVPWCNLVKHVDSMLTEGTLKAEHWTDYWLVESGELGGRLHDGAAIEVESRQGFGSGSDSSGETMDIRVVNGPRADTAVGRRLTLVQSVPAGHSECEPDSRRCFAVISVNYMDLSGELKTLVELADRSFGTVQLH